MLALTLGVEVTDNFDAVNDFDIFQVEALAGEHLIFQLRGNGLADDNELYVRFGVAPTLSEFDFAGIEPDQPGQVIDVASAQAGTYYVMAYSRLDGAATGSDAYRLRVDNPTTFASLTKGIEVTDGFVIANDFDIFQVEALAGEHLMFQLHGNSGADDNELYVRFGAAPTLSEFDFAGIEPDQPGQVIDVASAQAGTYYVMAYSRLDAGSRDSDAYRLRVDNDQTLPTLAAGLEVDGDLVSNDDFDLYQIHANAGDDLLFELNRDFYADDIELFIRFGAFPTTGDFDLKTTHMGPTTQMAFLSDAKAGTYYVMAYSRIDATSHDPDAYRLRVDNQTTIASLTTGVEVTDNFDAVNDFDIFQVEALAGEHLMFQLRGNGLADDNELYVRFGAAPTLSEFDFAGIEPDQPGQVIDVASAQAGTYYVMAYSRNDGAVVASDAYRLRVDNQTTIANLTKGVEVTDGFVVVNDFDIFKVEALAGEHLMFQLLGNSKHDDNELYVRFGAAPTLTEFDFAGIEPDQPGQVIDVASAQAGTYYVMAYSRLDGSLAGSDAYRLRMDTDATLPTLILGDEVVGNLNRELDSVFYRLDTLDEQQLFLTVSGASAFADRYIYARQGALPSTSTFDYAVTKPNQSSQLLQMPSTQAGTLYIRVYAADSSAKGQITILVDNIAFSKHTIDSNFGGADAIFAADLDGDQDMDFVAADRAGGELAWWEFDPHTKSYTKHIIDASFPNVESVFAADLDGDGDPDILAASFDDDEVAWWENEPDGFITKHVIDASANGAATVYAVDLDQDADFDVLVAASKGNELSWWRNDSSGNFVQQVIDSSFRGARGVVAADLDADGDLDVIGAATIDDEIAWWENDGNELFTKHVIDTAFDGAFEVHAADLTGNGLPDIFASAREGNELAWWRNDGGGVFVKHVLSTTFSGAEWIDTADFDLDGDLDLVAVAHKGDDVVWWKNQGAGVFQRYRLDGNFNGASAVDVADLDGDGDVDILATAEIAGEVAWWENLSLDKLVIVDITPGPGSAVAFFPTSVSVGFDNDVDVSTLTPQSFQVVGAGPDTTFGTSDDIAIVADSITYDAANRLAQFELAAGFSAGEYRVFIYDTVHSVSGGLLDGEGDYVTPHPDLLPSGSGVQGGDFVSGFFVDTTPPAEPAVLRSFSHVVGVPSQDDTVEVTWNVASDSLSGLAGYYTAWDTDPVTDPTGLGLVGTATVNITSPVLGDGQNHYFHIVAVDRAGNLSGVEHLGPFSVESGGPSVQFVSPSDGAVELTSPTSVRVGFHDYDLDPATLTPLTFRLEGSGGDGTFGDGNEVSIQDDDGVIDYDPVARVATFTPASPLLDGVYRVKVTDAVTDSLGNALNSIGSGNSGSDFVSNFQFYTPQQVSVESIGQDTTWRGLILVTSTVTVQPGVTLTVEPGSIVKFNRGSGLEIEGRLNALGTLNQPITFTSHKDDSVGGDSNQDGDSSSPAARDWDKLLVSHASGEAALNHVNIRYANRALQLTAGSADIANTTMRDGNFGIYIYKPFVTVEADNLLVANNRLTGVFVRAESTVLLRNATIVGNGFQGNEFFFPIFTGWHRAGIHVGGATVTVENSVVAFNANGLDHFGDPPLVTIRNSNFFNPDGKEIAWNSDPGIPDLSSNGNLSVDPLFVDRLAGNYELSAGSPIIDAGKGTDFPLTDILGRPRYDDAGIANIGSGAVPYVDFGAFERQVNSTPLDLAVMSVGAPSPSAVIEGGSFTVTWSASNTGGLPITGPWDDAVYLSSDTVFDPTDLLLGTVEHNGTLAVGASYTASLNAIAPATAGPQNILVRTNYLRSVREADETNNMGISTGPLEVNVPTVALGGSVDGIAVRDQWQYFRFDAAAGNSVRFSVDSVANRGTLGLYVRRAKVPTVSRFEVSSSSFGDPDPDVLLPNPVDATYYIGVYGQFIPGGNTNFTISAESTALSLESLGQSVVGTGIATLELLGENFSADDNVYLFAPDNVTRLDPLSTDLDDSTLAFAKFDFAGADVGSYDVVVEASTGELTTLFDVLTVEATGEAEFFLNVEFPSRTRPGRKATITLEFGNSGTVDMFSPMLSLLSDDDMSWRVPGSETFITTGAFEIMALSTTGAANVLRPGQQETLEIKIKTPFRQADIPYQIIPIGAFPEIDGTNELIDWDSLQAESRPESIAADAWEVIWSNVEQQTGQTWGDYVLMLGDNAAHLALLGDVVYDRGRLSNFEVIQASSWNPNFFLASALDASVSAPGLSLSMGRTFGQTIQSRYALGPFGRGWTHNYDLYLQETPDGDLLMHGPTASYRLFSLNDDGSFTSGAGDYGVLTTNGDGTYALREISGTTLRFNADLKLGSITDPNGNTIIAGYTSGLLTTLTHSAGQQLSFVYDGNNRIERLTDHFGRQTVYAYDASGEHLTSATQYGDEITRYDYVTGEGSAKEHALRSIQLPAGNHVFYEYDSLGRLVLEHLEGGEAPIAYSYDTSGTVTATDALDIQTLLRFDANGILRQVVDPLGDITQQNFDVNFNRVQSVRADGLRTTFSYDNRGNVTQVVDVAGNPTLFGYDTTYNNLQFFTDARGNTTNYEYDASGNLQGIVNPAGLAETFQVDSLGNVTGLTNRRGTAIEYAYDTAGQLTRKDFADGSFVTYGYLGGNLVTMIDSTGTTTFAYEDDLLSLVTSPSGRFLEYDYVDGRRTALSDQDGLLVRYEYDAAGRLDTLTDGSGSLLVNYGCDSRGLLDREDRGNGTFTTYLYDELGRVELISHHAADNSVASFFNYTYDVLSRRTAAVTHYGTWAYSYDLLGQLTEASLTSTDARVADTNLTYEYDAVGNRLRTSTNGVVTEYTVNNLNQYEQVGEDQYIYDDDGNLVLVAGPNNHREFVFSDENQLTRLTINGETQQFTYDGLGNRVGVNAAGIQRELVYDPTGLGDLIADVNLTSGAVTKFVHGFGLVVQLGDVGPQGYYAFDALGTTSQLFDAAGAIVNEYLFGPFGERLFNIEGIEDIFTFIGRFGIVDDGETFSVRKRSFDNITGRFISIDSIGLAGGFNAYTYAKNNPLSYVDVTGQNPSVVNSIWSNLVSTRIPMKPFNPKDPFGTTPDGRFKGKANKDKESPEHKKKRILEMLGRIFEELDARLLEALERMNNGGDKGGNSDPPDFPSFCELFPALCLTFCEIFPFWCDDAPSRGSKTPEDKFGPVGFDHPNTPDDQLQRFVAADNPFRYRIDFWNEPTAAVPTQDAILLDKLDPNLDWSTLSFTNFGFLSWNVDLPGGQVIDTQVDLRPEMNLAVNVRASFDQETGEIRWWFQAVDPYTGDYPEDPFAGFLPPFNEVTQFELGWVEFTVEPIAGLQTGTRIENQAFVQFDMIGPFNPAPKPDPWLNTIDAAAPTSQVSALPATALDASFLVEWSGIDDPGGSGLAGFDIFVSEDDGPFEVFLTNTTLTAAQFVGDHGKQYAFHSIARDNVGNIEAAPLTPDTTTTTPQPSPDLTGNGFVDFEDLTVLLAAWNQNVSAAEGNLVDADTTPVNFEDLTLLLAAWTGPGPAASPQPAATEASVQRNTATGARYDQLGRRAHTPSRRIDPSTKLSSHDSPLRRLQAAAVDRAMGEESESTLVRRKPAFVRRRR